MLTSGAFGYLLDYVIWWLVFASLLIHTWCFFRYFPRTRYKRLGLVLGNLLVFLCLLGVAALAGESYFRFASVETDSFGVSLPARRWFVLYTDLNSEGFRDREWARVKSPGVRRIAFVGDSFTYGWGIERPEDRFPDRIQSAFDRRARGSVEVMNLAKPGWNTGEQFAAIREGKPRYDIDEVVLCYVANDLEDLLPTSDAFNPTRPPEPKFFNIDSSCLLDYLYRRILVPRAPSVREYFPCLQNGYRDRALWRRQSERLRSIVDFCAQRGVTFRVVLLPLLKVPDQQFRQEEVHALLRDFFASHAVPVVDLLPVVSGTTEDLVVNARDSHPNERAHQLFAEHIWSAFYAEAPRPAPTSDER